MQRSPAGGSETRLDDEGRNPCPHDRCVNVQRACNRERPTSELTIFRHERDQEKGYCKDRHPNEEISERPPTAVATERI